MRTSTILRSLVMVAAGATAGVIGSLALAPRDPPTSSRTAHTSDAIDDRTAPTGSSFPRNPAQLSLLERRVQQLEARERLAIQENSPGSSRPAPDPAANEQQIIENHQRKVEQIRAQGVSNSGWAAGAQRSFESELVGVSKKLAFDVVSVECGGKDCLATVEWPSFAIAKESWKSLLHRQYDTNCAVEIALKDPEEADARYRTTVIYDCSEAAAKH